MTNYIATVKIKIDPQAHIDAKYGEYKKSLEKGKSATEAGLSNDELNVMDVFNPSSKRVLAESSDTSPSIASFNP